jgi:hypothetical protein
VALKRLVLLAAGAGAVWYAREKLSENGSEQPPGPPRQAQSPARSAVGVPDPPTPPAQPEPEEPPIETTAFQEPEVEPLASEPRDEEPPPAAFEDAHQEGWQDEQLGEDPKNLDELEIDPATAADADQDVALEEAEELAEPEHDTSVEHPRSEPAHVTRVVDDLLEGRRDEPEEGEIEDATLVEEERDRRSTGSS